MMGYITRLFILVTGEDKNKKSISKFDASGQVAVDVDA